MKALVIGAAGFVGNYLIDAIYDNLCDDILATRLDGENLNNEHAQTCVLDVLDQSACTQLFSSQKPDYIFHLAALSSVALSWHKPQLCFNINVIGTLNLLEAIRNIQNYNPRVLLIGSAEEYGKVSPEQNPICETLPTSPSNIYAATKASQNDIARIYFEAYDMDIITTRSFNHVGPAQADMFVISDFCKQVAQIEAGFQEPVIKVGNLDAARDFTDVRDVVLAYVALCKSGKSGEIYNVGSGKAHKISEMLDVILSKCSANINVEVDEQKFRPIDIPLLEANISKITVDTGWKPVIPIEMTIDDTLKYWKEHLRK